MPKSWDRPVHRIWQLSFRGTLFTPFHRRVDTRQGARHELFFALEQAQEPSRVLEPVFQLMYWISSCLRRSRSPAFFETCSIFRSAFVDKLNAGPDGDGACKPAARSAGFQYQSRKSFFHPGPPIREENRDSLKATRVAREHLVDLVHRQLLRIAGATAGNLVIEIASERFAVAWETTRCFVLSPKLPLLRARNRFRKWLTAQSRAVRSRISLIRAADSNRVLTMHFSRIPQPQLFPARKSDPGSVGRHLLRHPLLLHTAEEVLR